MNNRKMIGRKYGRLTVVSNPYKRQNDKYSRSCVMVECVCKNKIEVRVDKLLRGKVKSCGCLQKEIKKELKNRYGMLTVVSDPYRKYNLVGRAMYVDVMCDCGVKKYVKAISLKSGITKSCGCIVDGVNKKTHTTHGLSKHPLMKIWGGIIQRCTNKKTKAYKNYGARGVSVCKLWRNSYIDFYKWAIRKGWKRGLEIDKDKIPHRLGIPAILYSPKMCSILTKKENLKYKRSAT